MQLNYFAFGSNLSSLRLQKRLPGVESHCVATLAGHRLCWHKNGRDQSGKCDIVPSAAPLDIVYGVIYRMTLDEGLELDRYECSDFGYARKDVEVLAIDGRSIEAFTYYALDINRSQQPFGWYKEHVLRGAIEHEFPTHYIDLIESTPATDDADVERHQRELSIYTDLP